MQRQDLIGMLHYRTVQLYTKYQSANGIWGILTDLYVLLMNLATKLNHYRRAQALWKVGLEKKV